MPAAGAGNLETKASQDQYRFTVTAGQSVYVDAQVCAGGSGPYLDWRLVDDATGATVKSGGCTDGQTGVLAAGTYRLIVSVMLEHFGIYAVQIFAAPPPQVFNVGSLTSPISIANGVPGPGAGNLETKASQDQYVFTVAAGQSVYVDARTCVSGSGPYLAWRLVNDATGSTLTSGGCGDGQTGALTAGTYRLIVSVQGEVTGAYALQMFASPPAQVFDIGALTSPITISNGVPAAGAGTKASQDQYLFTVTAGQSIYVDAQTCVSGSGPYLAWRLVNDATGATVKSGGCTDAQTGVLAAGTYRLIVSVQGEVTGAYALQMFAAPPPQVFSVGALTSPITISNGVPAAGAGNLETKASQDQYLFTTAAGQSVYVDIQSCPNTYYLSWRLINDTTGTTAKSGDCSDSQTGTLAAGTYRLIVSVTSEHTGSYAARLYDPALPH